MQFNAINDSIVIIGVHDVATDTSAESRKLKGKQDALMNLVTQLAGNQKPASVASMGILRLMLRTHITDHHNNRDKALDSESGSQLLAKAGRQARCSCALGDSSSCELEACLCCKLEGKLDALMNLVTQLDANQKPASIARVYGIRSSIDHHTSVCPTSQQSGVDEHPKAYAANSYSRPVQQQGVNHVATDTSEESRKLEGKVDALVNLVTRLAVKQKPASVTRVCGICSSNDHHTSVYPSSQQSGVDEHPEAYAANTYSGPLQ
ncbi:hypothetical protein Fmac_028674 [Flemingia macrophylla]|uniref:Uncharacterized protein n=1 Tax=Flemingia macrophylla TaxID=520843 RepID=A0ABD1L863_9FABA